MKKHRIILFLIFLSMLVFGCASVKSAAQKTVSHKDSTIEKIVSRGTLLVGTTGDYRPLTYKEENGTYWGFGIEIAQEIAKNLGVSIEFVQTSWPTLTKDVLSEPKKFDFAIGGISITEDRCAIMDMSEGYLANGKTILCRKDDSQKFRSLSDIDRPEIRVMVNPGGLNERFARANLKNAQIIVFNQNEEIPNQVVQGNADIMITEITEAPWYVKNDQRLSAPLLSEPFTHGQIGVLMQKNQEDLLALVNETIQRMKKDGTLRRLHEKYGFSY